MIPAPHPSELGPHAPAGSRLPDGALARAINAALAEADAEAPLWDALDAAVDAVGRDAVLAHLRRLAERGGAERGGAGASPASSTETTRPAGGG